MKPIQQLRFGFSDAENYKRRENKELFNQLFIRTRSLDHLISDQAFFLIGEKGTGKTAYSVYLENNQYQNTRARISYIRETEYQSFIGLKKEKHLLVSDYAGIWKVILLVLLAKEVRDDDLQLGGLSKYLRFDALRNAIDGFYNRAFSPEIVNVFKMLHEEELAMEFFKESAKSDSGDKGLVSFTENRFQANLLYIEYQLRQAFQTLHIKRNLILFIDGIDIRPSNIPFLEYHECIKGLANAIWSLNNDFFPRLRDSAGRVKVVLLVRPDIFASLGLQNQNAKLRDNCVLLDWRTTYKECRYSELFRVADRILSSQQQGTHEEGRCWDYYFPYRVALESDTTDHSGSSFVSFLRYSYYRPRDIVTMLTILQELWIQRRKPADAVFSQADFNDSEFRFRYAHYLLGEVKDHLSFYYSDKDYELFLKFFEFLNGAVQFSYEAYCNAYNAFREFARRNNRAVPAFFDTADIFLQFLYELNILFFTEQMENGPLPLFRLCLRERSYSNLSPKVKTNRDYEIFYGISRALNLGKSYTRSQY